MIQISLSKGLKLRLWPKTRRRASNPVSAILRPVFESRRVKTIVGANLAAAMMVVQVVGNPVEAVNTNSVEVEAVTSSLTVESVLVTTEDSFRAPLPQIDISQGFRGGHPGVDLRALLKTPVHPVASGRVVEVTYGRFGYGRSVKIDHENGWSSLYAHLGEIKVKEGDRVEGETELGEVGLSGWTTGPHLHLEVYDQGRAINPKQVVPLN